MSQKVLVVGGAGLVGDALARSWGARGAQVSRTALRPRPGEGFLALDMRDEARVREAISREKPEWVAVPAANPFVDYCETHPSETRAVNVDGTLNVARACRDLGARMIFFSSDYVFDGVKGAYTEEDAPSPINEYGRQKADTERGVLAADPRNLVLRTSGVYGWEWEGKNFVLQVRSRLGRGEVMKIADDVSYNPTFAENLAEVAVALTEAGAAGIFHVVGAESIVRHEFAVRAARAFGLDESLLKPVPSSALSSPTPRPKASSLRTDKVRAAVAVPLIGPDEGLRRMLAMESSWRLHAGELSAAVATHSRTKN